MNKTNTNAAINPIIYSEKFDNGGTGELVVKQMKRDGSEFCLIGYVHAGIDIAPVLFARGDLDDCRKAYRAAREQMRQWYPARA